METIISIIAVVLIIAALIYHEFRLNGQKARANRTWEVHMKRHGEEQENRVSRKTHEDDYRKINERLDDLNARTSALQDVNNTLIKQSKGQEQQLHTHSDFIARHGDKIKVLWERHLSKQNQKRDGRGRYAKAEAVETQS